MTDVSTTPSLIDAEALQRLDLIVARAFGIEGGYRELNGIVMAAVGYNMFEEMGLEQSPMAIIAPALRSGLKAKGAQSDHACLVKMFISLPGSIELREWISRYCPAMLELVAQETFLKERAAYEQDRMDRRVRAIRFSLDVLAPTVTLSPAQKALARITIKKLNNLNDFKVIHDALHGLQMGALVEMNRLENTLILGDERRFSLGAQSQELRLAAERIAQRFTEPGAAESAVAMRDTAITLIDGILRLLDQSDLEARETPEAAAGLLRAMLRQQMGPFDSKLVETVDEIPFTEFAEMLDTLPPAQGKPVTAQGDPVLFANIGASFVDIRARLDRRRKVHRLWQQVDTTLLNVEELLRGAGREIELKIHWENLASWLGQIMQLNAEQENFTLPDPGAGDGPEGLGAQIRSDAYVRRFGFFVREARIRFQRADNALLMDCERLEELQQPLRILVGD